MSLASPALFLRALPFWLSLLLIPAMWLSAIWAGWAVVLVPLCSWTLFSVLDAAFGLNPGVFQVALEHLCRGHGQLFA